MNTVRMNITLPNQIAEDLKSVVGDRKRSGFIAESLRYHLDLLKKQQLEDELKEGYQSEKGHSLEISNDFEASDLEGWHDY